MPVDMEEEAKVCGDWLLEGEQLRSGEEYDYPHMPEDNEQWMKDMPSAFIPAGMIAPGMERRWRDFGASEQILGWIRDGGYKVKGGGKGVGFFQKNGK
jgi:hypothetical protein